MRIVDNLMNRMLDRAAQKRATSIKAQYCTGPVGEAAWMARIADGLAGAAPHQGCIGADDGP